MKQQASAIRRRRKRRWLQLLATASSNPTTTIFTTAHNYQHEARKYCETTRGTGGKMVAISALCTSVIVCIALSTIMSYQGDGGGCHAAPSTLDLVSKLAHRGSSSSSPGPSHSGPSSASHLVKSARLATYSLSCPPEASIHPCTCIYHTPGAGIESEEEEEEIFELSPAITTPYAEPLVQTTTPATSMSTTTTVPTSTPTASAPVAASSPREVDATDRRTESVLPLSSLASAPTTTTTTTTTTTLATSSISTTTTTTAAPTQSAITQHRDAQIGSAHEQQQAVPSFVVTTTTAAATTHEPRATSTTPLAKQQTSSDGTTTSAPALKTTTPVDGTTATITTTRVTARSGGGAQIASKESIADSTTVRPQQNEATTTGAPLTSGRGQGEPATPVAIQTKSSASPIASASVEFAGGQESRNGAIASSSSSVNLNISSSAGQASTAGAVGHHHQQQQQQQEAVVSEKRPAQNPTAADQKIPARQPLDSLAPPLPSPQPQPQPQLEPYQPPLVQPPPPGSIVESPARVGAGEQASQQSPSNHMTNANRTDKQTNLELELDTTATSGRVISSATAQALELAQPLVAETTEIPLRLTPSSTTTIWTETQESHQPQAPKLTSGGSGPFVFVSETARMTSTSTTPMPLQTTSASVAPSQSTTASLAAGISVASSNLTVPAATATEKPSSVGTNESVASTKVAAVENSTTNESGRASAASTTTTVAAPTAPGLELSGARHDKQEAATSPRPTVLGAPAPYAAKVTSAQAENNGNGTPASPISSSASPLAAAAAALPPPPPPPVVALNETKHDYNVVSVATVAGVESTNLPEQRPLKTPTGVISSSPNQGGGATIHEVPHPTASAQPNQGGGGDGGERLDLGSARANDASTLRPVTLDTLAATSTTTVAPATFVPSLPVSVTNQSASTGAPTPVVSGQGSRQQSNASESSAAASASAPATIGAPAAVQPALVSSLVQSVKPQHDPVPNSSIGTGASQSHAQSPGAGNPQAGAVDQTNPAPPSPTHTIHRPANNGTTHRAGPPPGNSSAPRASGERPASAGRAIHHKPLIVGGGNNTTSQHHNQTTAHPNQAKPAAHSNNNHQSLAAAAAQNGRQILTPNTHKPKPHSSRPTAAGNHHNHHHINSSGHHNNHAANSPGGRELPQAAGTVSSFGPPLRRSTRSAGTGGARPPMHAQTDHTGGHSNRSPPSPKLQQRLTPNTLSAQAARRPNVVVTSAPNANPQFTNSSGSSQRAPGGRRLTRFLSHDHHSANMLSAQDPFADANEQKVEVVAYCRNIQNMQVLRSAIKGFRGHQVNYFVIDSCKVPPFPNDLFHGIDVRWLEMSNSTVQFHNNFLHGAHHNQQGQLA